MKKETITSVFHKNKLREIYIGNGETICVEPHKNNMIALINIPMLDDYFNKNPKKSITIGAKRDWFFTATSINKNDLDDIKNSLNRILIFSDWDTFKFTTEDGKEYDCTVTIDKNLFNIASLGGYNQAINRMNIWFSDLHHLLYKLPDNQRESLSKKIKTIAKSYMEVVK